MQEIKTWLENPERKYREGIELYHKYGRNKLLLSNFQKKETKYHWEKLTYELGKISDYVPPKKEISTVSPSKQKEINEFVKKVLAPVHAPSVPLKGDEGDTTLSNLEKNAASLFNQRAVLSNKLTDPKLSDAGRKQVVDELDDVETRYYAMMQKVIDYKATGVVTEEVKKSKRPDKYILPTDDIEKLKALSNARSRRVKAKNKKNKCAPGTPKYNKFASEELKEEKFIKQLEGIIK
jgi:hypothetical protein